MATTPKSTVSVSRDVHRRTKAMCEARGVSMSEWVDALLSMALDAPEPKAPARPCVRPQPRLSLD